jgi:hypothetical protein
MLLLIPAAFLSLAAADLPATGPVPEQAPREEAAPAPSGPQMKLNEKQASPPSPAPPQADEAALAECERRLTALGVEFERRAAIDGPGRCGLPAAYSVTKVARGVSMAPETKLTCETALATARWIRLVVIPAARVFGNDVRLTGIRQASTYVCRTRNGQPDAKISEHARGRAIDVATFEFEGRPPLSVMPEQRTGSAGMAFQKAVRAGACLHFTTVLGPGADAFHDDHVHLDLAKRRGGYRLCQ